MMKSGEKMNGQKWRKWRERERENAASLDEPEMENRGFCADRYYYYYYFRK